MTLEKVDSLVLDRKAKRREIARRWAEKHRRECEEKGVCVRCGDLATNGSSRCDKCRREMTQNGLRNRRKKIAAGKCDNCGEPAEIGQRCKRCRLANRVMQKERQDRYRAEGRCINCGEPSENKRCLACNRRSKDETNRRRTNNQNAGYCRTCGKNQQLKDPETLERLSNHCDLCYLKIIARNMLGTAGMYPVLLDKLYRQDWRCYYTGERLVLGRNLSFDHVKPRSRFPELEHDPDNLVPVDTKVNFVKRDLTGEEFIDLATKVHNHKNVLIT